MKDLSGSLVSGRTGTTPGAGDHTVQMRGTGIWWASVDTGRITPGDTQRAQLRFRTRLPDLVWNAARLEGNALTLPEVRALLGGSTASGRASEDELQVLALSEAYGLLDELVGSGTFQVDKSTSDRLHGIVARHEALDAGRFRGEGTVTGGGTVRLASGGIVEGTPHGEGGELLRSRFDTLVERLTETDDARLQALIYFSSAARSQFYFDGNKRTARLMMTGILMSNGFDAVNIPYARRLEFNHALDALFTSDNATELMAFLVDCTASEG